MSVTEINTDTRLAFIDKEIEKTEKLLNIYAINSDSYKEVYNLYKDLIATKSELISQEERLIAIYKNTTIHLVRDENGKEHIEPMNNNSEKSIYQEFLDSIDSETLAEMRPVKDDILYVPITVKNLKDKFFAIFKKEQKEYEDFKQEIYNRGL